MFNVTITYKSGKVEEAKIHQSLYAKALVDLVAEGRIVSMVINSVE